MIRNAAARGVRAAAFVAGCAEKLPFAGAMFGLVVVTLSMAHWWDVAAGLGEVRRVMAPGAVLVAAETMPVPRSRLGAASVRWRRLGVRSGLPSLIAASGLRVRSIEPIHPVAVAVDAVLVAADLPR
jgi:ubiquinone/menaquinone biosynthesis C-methylase UbiE